MSESIEVAIEVLKKELESELFNVDWHRKKLLTAEMQAKALKTAIEEMENKLNAG